MGTVTRRCGWPATICRRPLSRARARHRRLRPGRPSRLAGGRTPAGGDRRRHARRRRSHPVPLRAGPGSRRARPHALPLPHPPAPGLLERRARQRTAHAALSADILSRLAGTSPPGASSSAAQPGPDPRPALPAGPPVRSGDRGWALRAGSPALPARPAPTCPPRASRGCLPPGMPSRSGRAEREMEVLRLAAAGRGNRDIASELSISPKTASVRVQYAGRARRLHPHRSRRHHPPAAGPRRPVTSAALTLIFHRG